MAVAKIELGGAYFSLAEFPNRESKVAAAQP